MGVRFVVLDLMGRGDVEGVWLRNRSERGKDLGQCVVDELLLVLYDLGDDIKKQRKIG